MEQRLCFKQRCKGVEVVRFLVESGANKDQGRTDGATPLFVAAQEGRQLKLSDFWLSQVPTKTNA